jgi:adenine-specific DNA-methyltransferase
MARLEDLITDVPDAALRRSIEAEVALLKRHTGFGLVFERHEPESVLMAPRSGLQVGDRVRLRKFSKDKRDLVVRSVTAKTASVSDGDGSPERVSISDLLVVKDFGEPIFPTLSPLGAVHRSSERPPHLVIDSDNFYALELLAFTHENKVDVMYLDPPYNTGARDWKYNNDYVDDSDRYRSSKWLSAIERRLRLAKRVLKRDGTLIVTIDEKEVIHLGMLLEDMFPGAVRQLVTIVINPLGQARKRELARVEEYAFFVFLGQAAATSVADDLLSQTPDTKKAKKVRWEWLIRGGTHSRREDRPNLFYPIFVDPAERRIVRIGDSLPRDADRHEIDPDQKTTIVWPLNTNGDEGNWRCSPGYLRELVSKGYAKLGAYDAKNDRHSMLYLGKAQIGRVESGEIKTTGRDENGAVILEGDVDQRALTTAKTVWSRLSHRAGEHGSALVKRFLGGREFPFPKSLYSVTDTLRIACGDNPDAIILDFFAGSGTTLHAACLLNAEDDGRRQVILVTNNEVSDRQSQELMKKGLYPGDADFEKHGIFEYIARPRVTAAITGKTPSGKTVEGSYLTGRPYGDGFEENVEFFRLGHLDPNRVELGLEYPALQPLLWLKAGALGKRETKLSTSTRFQVSERNGYAVLFNEVAFGELVADIGDREAIHHVFLATSSEDAYAEMSAALPDRTTHMLPRDYLRFFRSIPERSA